MDAESSGLRRRRTAPTSPSTSSSSASGATRPSAAGFGSGFGRPGTVAAAFRNSKGSELQTFAARLIAGAGFETETTTSSDGEFTVLLINLPLARMVETADELGLRKRDLEGNVRTFAADNVGAFAVTPSAEALFSQAERILLTEYCLDNVKPDQKKFDDVQGNESLLEWCKRQKYLEDVFPLHDKAAAQDILNELSFKTPMFDVGGIAKVQDYFGDKVALYFSFLTFYTQSLFWYAAAGVFVFAVTTVSPTSAPVLLFVFSIFATLWGAALTSLWKRRNVEIVYMWTSLVMGDSSDESLMSMSQKEDLRNEFYGDEVSHRITGERIVVFPRRKKLAMYLLSSIVVLSCLYISCRAMLAALDFEDILGDWLVAHGHEHKWSSPWIMRGVVLKNMPLVVYLGCLTILDTIYSMVAVKLTALENHKYQSRHENSHVLKLVLFQFLNMNMAYLYVAFVRRDYVRLSAAIRSILITELLIGNIKETIVPIVMAKRRKSAKVAAAVAKKKADNPDLEESECAVDADSLDDPVSSQLEMEEYGGFFSDYFELVRQFSQITLFAAAFPLGALLALLNNFMEIYTDTYKLVHMTRRASPHRALDIGAWIRAFEFISIMSIMTNLGIITVTAGYAHAVVGKGIPKTEEYGWMVVVEHGLLVARFVFMGLFEGIPSWVRDQRARSRYLSSKRDAGAAAAASR
jgi:Calcium-activated chloride channel